jgi:hypothetical protein
MDGYEVAHRLHQQEEAGHVKLVAVTRYGNGPRPLAGCVAHLAGLVR